MKNVDLAASCSMTRMSWLQSGVSSRAIQASIMGVLVFAWGSTACATEGHGPAADEAMVAHALATKFKPVMWFEREEMYRPMSADTFISQSRLKRKWQKRHRRLLPDADQNWYFEPHEEHWKKDETGLGGDGITPSDLRSYGFPNDKKQWLEPHANRLSMLGSNETIDGIVDDLVAPAYYTYSKLFECHLISYWFLFGFSEFLSTDLPSDVEGNHEGDWESMSLLVKDDSIHAAWFNSHGDYQKKDLEIDSATKRPVGYFARDRHGLYEKAGAHWVVFQDEDFGEGVWVLRNEDTFRVTTQESVRVLTGGDIRVMLDDVAVSREGVVVFPTEAEDVVLERVEGDYVTLVKDILVQDQTGRGARWETFDLFRIEDQEWQGWEGRWGSHGSSPVGPTPGKRGRLYGELMARLTSQPPNERQCAVAADETMVW